MTISAALNHYLQDVYISHLFVGMKTVHLNTTKCGFERWLRHSQRIVAIIRHIVDLPLRREDTFPLIWEIPRKGGKNAKKD